jgi:hypothetical protein
MLGPTIVPGLESNVTLVSNDENSSYACAVQLGALKCWLEFAPPGYQSTPTTAYNLNSGVTEVSGNGGSICVKQNSQIKCRDGVYITNWSGISQILMIIPENSRQKPVITLTTPIQNQTFTYGSPVQFTGYIEVPNAQLDVTYFILIRVGEHYIMPDSVDVFGKYHFNSAFNVPADGNIKFEAVMVLAGNYHYNSYGVGYKIEAQPINIILTPE